MNVCSWGGAMTTKNGADLGQRVAVAGARLHLHQAGALLKIVSLGATTEQWADWLKGPLKYARMAGSLELVDTLRVAGGIGGSEQCLGCKHPYPRRASLLQEGCETEVFALMSSGGTPEEWADWLRVPLEHAAARGNLDLVDALLQAGANGGAGWKGCRGRTLLDAAALGGNVDVVSALVGAGAGPDVNVVSVSSKRSALYTATYCGHEACARRFIEAGADVNFKGSLSRCSVLHRAIEGGHEQLVNDLLDGGADVGTREERDGFTAVHFAAYTGHGGSLSALLRRGADEDAVDSSGSTPLMVAATEGHLAVVNTLLGAGADTSVRNRVAGTALHYAAFAGHVGVMSALLLGGADTEARTNDGHTPLILAAYHGFVSAADAVIAAGANVDAVGNQGRSALIVASFKGHLPVVESLGAADADPNIRSTGVGRAALHYAADQGLDEIVCTLLRNGADKDACANNGTTPMWTAAAKGHVSVVKTLAAAGANANIPNPSLGSVPLHHVADGGHHEVVSSLLREGADVDKLDRQGMTPLAWAARSGHVLVVERLIAAGADLGLRCRLYLCSALDWAATAGKAQVIEALISRGAELDARSLAGETALHKAARHHQPDAVEALVKAGADIELRTDRELTPLLAAARGDTFGGMIALLEHGAAVNVRDEKGDAPLHWVCRGQHQGLEQAIHLLLLRGADENLSNSQGHAPVDLLDVRATHAYRRCSDEEKEGARRLLSRASANRAWGRRSWLIVLRARGAGGGKWGGGAKEQEGGLSGAVSMLLAMASEDMFRTTVSFI